MPATKATPITHQPICLKLDDVCQLLQISQRAIYRFVAAGKFPKPTKVGRSNRWLASTVFDFLRTGQIQEVEQ